MENALKQLHCQQLQITPFALRHGGASEDRAVNASSLEEVQKCAGWKSFNRVRRNEKHARLSLVMSVIPPELLRQGSHACAHWTHFGRRTSSLVLFQHSPSWWHNFERSRICSSRNGILKFSTLVGFCVLVLRSESMLVNTAPCDSSLWTRPLRYRLMQHVEFCAGGGRFRKRTGMLYIHCGTPPCRSLQCRSTHRICTFTGLPHQHWKNPDKNEQSSLVASMPQRIAVFVSDCLRHRVMNITVPRLASLVSW